MTDIKRNNSLALELPQINEKNLELDAKDVRAFLLNNPDFFAQNPDIVEKVTVPHSDKGSVSLVALQSEQQRKKIRLLNTKLAQLISVAKKNEKIYRVYVSLNLKLMKCKSISDIQTTLEDVMLEQLNLASVHLIPFKGPLALPELQQRFFIEKRFRQDKFFFGRLGQHEKQLLFKDEIAESVALVLIENESKALGLLAVGSKDAGHFGPNMDTLLLRQLQDMLSILLNDFMQY